MRFFPAAVAGVLALGVVVSASVCAQSRVFPHQKNVFGYQDENGVFHPAAQVAPDASTATTVTGKVVVTFHITPKTSFPSGTKIYCGANLLAASTNELKPLASATYEEGGAALASGDTCTVTINYSWTVSPSGTGVENLLTGSYSVVAIDSSYPTLVSEAVGVRESNGTIPGMTGTIPPTGMTTNLTVNVTL